MKYSNVYSCWLFDEVKSGKEVYALDKRVNEVYLINKMPVEQLVAIMHSAEQESSRYEFWYEETEEKENVEEL